MKQLSLLRHSRAGQTNKKLTDDHERPLTKKGEDVCLSITTQFQSLPTPPDLILISTARRTVQTADRVFRRLFHDLDVPLNSRQIKRLYLADVPTLLSVIAEVPDEINHLAVVAHNPGLQQLALDLAGEGDVSLFRDMRNSFPPPSLAHFEFNIQSWEDVRSNGGFLKLFSTGKGV